MKKQTISLALALCLFGSTAQAGFIDAFKKGFQNGSFGQLSDIGSLGTNFSNITNPQPIENGYYGGSIEFKVDANSMVYQPWVDFKEPSVRATCGDFTLDGGFIDLLGLEDIAEQLGNAASALAYGLLIALVNSMPSIEHVFSGIKRIIQQIQGLLANACNIGQNMGKSALNTLGVSPGLNMQGSINKAQNWLNKGADYVEGEFKKVLDSTDSTGSDKDQVKQEAATMFRNIFKLYDYTPLLAASIGKAHEGAINSPGFVNFDQKTIDKNGLDNARMMYLFAVNFFGIPNTMGQDFYDTLNANNSQGMKIPEFIAKGTLSGKEAESEALKNFLAKQGAAAAKGKSTKENSNPALYKPIRTEQSSRAPKQFIDELLNGGKNNKIELYSTKVLYGAVKAHDQVLTFMATINFDKKEPYDWKGLLKESEEIIKCRKSSLNQNNGANSGNTAGNNKCGAGSINLIVPGAMDMLNTIVSLEAMSQNTDYDLSQRQEYENQAKDLEYLLAKTNAYFCAQFFLENLQAQKTEGVTLVGGKASMTQKQMTESISMLETYLKELDESIGKKTQKLHEFKTPYEKADKALQEIRNKNESKKAKTKGQ